MTLYSNIYDCVNYVIGSRKCFLTDGSKNLAGYHVNITS